MWRLALLVFGSLVACSPVPLPGPLTPLSAAAGAIVLLENFTEDPLCDVNETSLIEMVADLLVLPINVFWQVIAYEGSLIWSVIDVAAGHPLQPADRFAQLLAWLPLRYSGVPPPLPGQPPLTAAPCRPQ